MYCEHCGTKLSEHARFCPTCGSATSEQPLPMAKNRQAHPTQHPAPKRIRRGKPSGSPP